MIWSLKSQPKHMLWVLKRTVSLRRFFWAPKTYVKKMVNWLYEVGLLNKYLQLYSWNGCLSGPKKDVLFLYIWYIYNLCYISEGPWLLSRCWISRRIVRNARISHLQDALDQPSHDDPGSRPTVITNKWQYENMVLLEGLKTTSSALQMLKIPCSAAWDKNFKLAINETYAEDLLDSSIIWLILEHYIDPCFIKKLFLPSLLLKRDVNSE